MNARALVGWTVVVAAVAGGLWWWSGHSGTGGPGAAAGAASAPHSQAVTLFTVRRQDMPVTVEASGTVVPLNTVEVRPQVSTTVRSVAIEEGRFVRQGDLLFTLDDRADQANLEKARATLLHDQATLADLERQWRRNQELLNQNFVSQGAVDSIQAQRDAQLAVVASDQAAVRAAQVNVGYNTVRAPLNGRAGAIAVHPGSLVTPTGNALVTISQIDPIAVGFTLPEAQLPSLLGDRQGRHDSLPVTVLRQTAEGADAAPMTGHLSFLDNTVDSASGTIKLKAELANPDQALWPGQYVTVRLTLRTLKDVAVVPQAALIIKGIQGEARQVYVAAADRTVGLRTVTVLNNAGLWAAVTGVQPGERVVMEGKENLRPGTPVHETGQPAGQAGAAGAASAVSAGTGT